MHFQIRVNQSLLQVRILASYYVGDKETGEQIYLSGDRDILFDVTALTMKRVHSSNIGVAIVLPKQDRIFIIANRPGSARFAKLKKAMYEWIHL